MTQEPEKLIHEGVLRPRRVDLLADGLMIAGQGLAIGPDANGNLDAFLNRSDGSSVNLTGEVLFVRSTSDLTLTTSYQSIVATGGDSNKLRILLPTIGEWAVLAVCDFDVTTGGVATAVGSLFVDDGGAAETGSIRQAMATVDRATVFQQWKITTTAANTSIELKAIKTDNVGVAKAKSGHTTLMATIGAGGGSTVETVDHGTMTGRGDKDHGAYLPHDGTTAMSGNLDIGSNNITDVAQIELDNNTYIKWKDNGGTLRSILLLNTAAGGGNFFINCPAEGKAIYVARSMALAEVAFFGGAGGDTTQTKEIYIDATDATVGLQLRDSPSILQRAAVWNGGFDEEDMVNLRTYVEARTAGAEGTREATAHFRLGTYDTPPTKDVAFMDFLMNGGPAYEIQIFQNITFPQAETLKTSTGILTLEGDDGVTIQVGDAGKSIWMDAGGSFYFRDSDAADAERVIIDSSQGTTKPGADNAADLGTAALKWKDLYLAGSITVGGTVDGVDIAGRDHAQAHGPPQHTGGNADKALYLDSSGDEQEVALVAGGSATLPDRFYRSSSATGAPDFKGIEQKVSITIEDPVTDDNITISFFNMGATIREVHALCTGGTHVDYNLYMDATRTTETTKVFSSDVEVTAGTSMTRSTPNTAAIAADDILFIDLSHVSGTPTEFHVTIRFTTS